MDWNVGSHSISFSEELKPLSASVMPEESVSAFTAQMFRFPLGSLRVLSIAGGLDTVQLFYDVKRSHFFAASINTLLTAYGVHLSKTWREEQQKRVRTLKALSEARRAARNAQS